MDQENEDKPKDSFNIRKYNDSKDNFDKTKPDAEATTSLGGPDIRFSESTVPKGRNSAKIIAINNSVLHIFPQKIIQLSKNS